MFCSHIMATYKLERTQIIAATLEKTWDFFSSPENLDKLTPANMRFDILTKRPLPRMYEGQILEYKVRPVLGIPLYWRTKITEVRPMKFFIDNQTNGPYNLWRHKHTFEEHRDGVKMKDHVTYSLPMGILGSLVHKFYVQKRLEEIFDYRYKVVDQIFNQKIEVSS